MTILLLLACLPSRDTFPSDLAEAVCARAEACQADDTALDTAAFDVATCVEQETRMNTDELCAYSGWAARTCLKDAQEESCADRERRHNRGEHLLESCRDLFVCA